jgi:putative transposase
MEILNRCFEQGENVQLVSEETGYSSASIYKWHRKYVRKGIAALLNTHDDARFKLKAGKAVSSREVEKLKAQFQDMQLEIDTPKETMNVLKKTQAPI